MFRIVVPDFDLALQKYREGDETFFDQTWGLELNAKYWNAHRVSNSIENKLLAVFAAYNNMDHVITFDESQIDLDAKDEDGTPRPIVGYPVQEYLDGYYVGPPQNIAKETVRQNAFNMTTMEFSEWAITKVPNEHVRRSYGHINCWDFHKLKAFLTNAGFEKVIRSDFLESSSRIMRSCKFDKEEHKDISLYVEAFKI